MSAGNPGRIKAGAHGDGSYFHALETLMLAYINDGTSTGSHGFQPPTPRSVLLPPIEKIFELNTDSSQGTLLRVANNNNNTLKKSGDIPMRQLKFDLIQEDSFSQLLSHLYFP